MTMREVQIALQNIEIRNYNKDALKVKLKGHKIKLKDHSYYKVISLKEDSARVEDIHRHMMAAINRRGGKFRNGHRPKN
jgi:hypothetical protein